MSGDFDSLIDGLSGDLKPVKKMPHPFVLSMPLFLASLVYIAVIITMIGPRHDLIIMMLQDKGYVFELLLALSISISAALTLGWLAFPDMRGQEWIKAIPVTLSVAFFVWAILEFTHGGENVMDLHVAMDCFYNGLVLLFLPMILLVLTVRGGATTRPGWAAGMTILSYSGLGWVGLRLTCGMDNFAHSFVFDFLPFVATGIVFGFFARRIFRW